MVFVNCILTDRQNKTVGAQLDVDGDVQNLDTEQLKVLGQDLKIENGTIDKNGRVRGRNGIRLPRYIMNTIPNAIEQREKYKAKMLLGNRILTLYHGNKNADMVPVFGCGEVKNDYGQGFYTTPDKELGKEWAWGTYTTGDKGYLHIYELDVTGLRVCNLTELDSVHWIAELLSNRTLNIENREVYLDTAEKFMSKYKINTDVYDIMIGYRADDSYFTYAEDFVRGAIYRETVEKALRNGQLGLQVFIKSERAFHTLKPIGLEEVPALYEEKYKRRDKMARESYYQDKREQTTARKRETIHHLI